jgi:flagellar protein FlaF
MSQALKGYAEHATSTKSDRRAEYEVIAKVTQQLRDRAVDAKQNFSAYADALHNNQKLWTALVVDVADPANPLPDELKARVMYLADFTRHHTRRILRD